jgi:hypothetical protein
MRKKPQKCSKPNKKKVIYTCSEASKNKTQKFQKQMGICKKSLPRKVCLFLAYKLMLPETKV